MGTRLAQVAVTGAPRGREAEPGPHGLTPIFRLLVCQAGQARKAWVLVEGSWQAVRVSEAAWLGRGGA